MCFWIFRGFWRRSSKKLQNETIKVTTLIVWLVCFVYVGHIECCNATRTKTWNQTITFTASVCQVWKFTPHQIWWSGGLCLFRSKLELKQDKCGFDEVVSSAGWQTANKTTEVLMKWCLQLVDKLITAEMQQHQIWCICGFSVFVGSSNLTKNKWGFDEVVPSVCWQLLTKHSGSFLKWCLQLADNLIPTMMLNDSPVFEKGAEASSPVYDTALCAGLPLSGLTYPEKLMATNDHIRICSDQHCVAARPMKVMPYQWHNEQRAVSETC